MGRLIHVTLGPNITALTFALSRAIGRELMQVMGCPPVSSRTWLAFGEPSSLRRFVWYNLNHGTWTDVLGCESTAAALMARFHAVHCCPLFAEIG